MNKLMGKAFLITLAESGVIIESDKISDDRIETLYISVPEHSYQRNAKGEEMSGRILAKRVREMFTDLGMGTIIIKWKTRKGENWTKELGKIEYEKMKRTVMNI